MPYRLAILDTHPIQYKAPWFRALHAHPEIDLKVFFCMLPDARQQGAGFGVEFSWDIPLLEGYPYEVLPNKARAPGTGHFGGCDTPEIARHVRDGGFHAFLVNGWFVKSMIQCAWACRRYGIPCLVRGDSNDLLHRSWWKTWIHRCLLKLYSGFLVVGTSNRDFYLHRGISPEKIVFGPHCVDNQRFQSQTKNTPEIRRETRRRWGIPHGAVCFLFCGKMETKKRPLDVLKAFAELQTHPTRNGTNHAVPQKPVHLLMVGDGEFRAECESYAVERNLPVTFAGFVNQSQIPKVYVASDCLVLPSDYWETWGLVVNEAFACGIPAIVSDRVGCHPDLILQGRTGWVVPFEGIDGLAQAMIEAAAAPGRLHEMGKAAREHIQTYTIEALVEGTLQALRLVGQATDA